MSSAIAVIDFETTGMTPTQGARATEVAIVLLEQGRVVDRFQSLMQTGAWVSPFITQLTGITNEMLRTAPPAADVMREAAPHAFVCTVLLSRRIYPQAPSHSLGNLARYLHLPPTGRAHRALADAEMAAALLGRMQQDLCTRHALPWPEHALLMQLQRCSKARTSSWLAQQAAQASLTAG
ncbi:MAG: 3'-5' exonuclease [Comamonas sp.]|jgi:DNA polymerase-3 subunit epsilon|uniref:3'-5' exonuclease n=1 Tax=Comamonas sp. TaxID=34028 RepID=UPI002820BC60|nr:3'-5' exonuclease [Comamonas sp.]MDR0216491.1 3'-5' exonuclease [Comamonas sp.]